MLNPAYDNSFFQPKMHPVYTNYTIDSWRADILDFGSTKQQGTGGTDRGALRVSFCTLSKAQAY